MPWPLALCLVWLAGVGSVATAGDAQRPTESARGFVAPVPDARLLAAVQQALEPGRRRNRSPADLARALGALGSEVAPVLVAMLVGDEPTTDWEASGLTLAQAGPDASADRAVLLAALRLLPEARVARALGAACAGDAPLERRLVGLSALAELGGASTVATWIELVQGIEAPALERDYVRARLDAALSHCLAGSSAGFELLRPRLSQLDEPRLRSVARATALAGRGCGVEFLWLLRGRSPALDREVVAALAALTPRTLGELGPQRCAWLRELLCGADARGREAAAAALGCVADADSAPQLLAALADPEAAVARSARGALEALAGNRGPREERAFETWLAGERAWEQEERPRLLEQLRAEDTARALEAASELARHPLFRHESSRAIAAELARTDADFVQGACAALVALRSAVAVDALVELLAVDDPGLQQYAQEALRALTGRRLPPDADAWRAATRD